MLSLMGHLVNIVYERPSRQNLVEASNVTIASTISRNLFSFFLRIRRFMISLILIFEIHSISGRFWLGFRFEITFYFLFTKHWEKNCSDLGLDMTLNDMGLEKTPFQTFWSLFWILESIESFFLDNLMQD